MTDEQKTLLNRQQWLTMAGYAGALILCVAAVVAATLLFRSADPVEQALKEQVAKADIIGLFQGKAQLATTEVAVRRMGIYDSDTRLATINPAQWRLGRRACIMPVDITIKYGIDMRKLKDSDVVTDSTNTVRIRLPEPEVIDYNVEMRTDRTEVVTMSGWLRDEVGEQTMQTIKNKVVSEVLADTVLFGSLRTEVMSNTKAVFTSMLQQMNLNPIFTN